MKRAFEILGTVMAWLLFGIMGLIVVSLALRILPVSSPLPEPVAASTRPKTLSAAITARVVTGQGLTAPAR